MKTIVCNLNENEIDWQWITKAGEILSSGGLVAIPTETVYGLGANALDSEAAAKIYAAKGRPSDNPLIIHIADKQDLDDVAIEIPESARKLADTFWPGPLTMILKKADKVPVATTGGLSTVAVRMPSHPVALEIIKASGTYIAAPSANTSGKPSPTSAAHVIDDMQGKIEMIVDSGDVGIGIESTIVDLTGAKPMILRPGFITREMLEVILPEVTVDRAILSENQEQDYQPKAPGMKYKHYAPLGDLTLVDGPDDRVINKINELVLEKETSGARAGVIAVSETIGAYQCTHKLCIGSRQNTETIAHNLYKVLRRMDELEVDYIYCESFGNQGLLGAIMNRLMKAAGYQIINV